MGKENKTVYAILGLLSHEDMTGYDIKKKIDETLSFFWSAGFGQIYPALKQLEAVGAVSKRTEKGENSQHRIVYSITESGRNKLQKWLEISAEKEYVKYEILLKLFFGDLLPVEDNIKKIEEFKIRNMKNRDIINRLKQNLNVDKDISYDEVYYSLALLLGEKVYKAYVEWASEAVEFLEKNTTNF